MGKTQTVPNFQALWLRLRTVYSSAGKHRNVAVLDNHKNRKEIICRKFGVVCDADINRIAESLKPTN
jgi:hypothetical protein